MEARVRSKDDGWGVLIPRDGVEHGFEFRPFSGRVDAEHVVSVKVKTEDLSVVDEELFKFFFVDWFF